MQQFMLQHQRAEIARLKSQHRALVGTSRANLASQARVHAAVLALLAASSFEQLIQIVTTDLAVLLDADVVTIAVEFGRSGRASAHQGVQILDPGTVDAVLGVDRDVVLGSDTEGDPTLFGDGAGLVRSAALLRLSVSARGAGRAALHRHAPARQVPWRPGHRAAGLPRPRARHHHRRLARPAGMIERRGPAPVPLARFPASPDLADAIADWQSWLSHERRASPHTRRGLWQRSRFLPRFPVRSSCRRAEPRRAGNLGPSGFPSLSSRAARPMRKCAARPRVRSRCCGASSASSTGAGLVRNAALAAVRTPKLPRSVPKALSAVDTDTALNARRDREARAPWIRQARPGAAVPCSMAAASGSARRWAWRGARHRWRRAC